MDEESIITRTPRQLRISTAIFFFISGFGYATWASRISTIQKQLHLNEAQLGLVLFALPVGLMFTMPITSRLLTHYSSRAIILIGSVFLNVILVLIGLTNGMWQLMLMLFFFGSARNLLTLSINTMGVGVQGLYKKSIMAAFHGLWSLASFAGGSVGLLMVYFNVIPAWHFVIVSVLLTIFTLFFIRNTLYQKPIPQSKKPIFTLPDKYLFKYSLVCFATMACENTMYDWSAIYFQKVVHAEKTTAIAALVVYLVAMTTGRFLGDKLVTRSGVKTVLKFSGILIFCGLMLAVALPYTVTALFGFLLVGFGVSCIVPMVYSLAGKSKSMSSSAALASMATVGYMGFLLVPPFVGFIGKLAGLRWSFGIIALFGALIVFLVSKITDEPESQISPVILPDYE